jgi:hypothetical protein
LGSFQFLISALVAPISRRGGVIRSVWYMGDEMATLTVGPGQQYTTIEDAVAVASPGDTVDVQAGIYTNDFVSIFQNLTLQAIGGPVQMVDSPNVDPPNGKAIINEGGPGISVTINGFDISGAVVPDGNGAAIRYEGGNLTLNNDYFHSNQDGVLAAADPNGTITINNSEFAFNGAGDGLTHNLYVNDIALLTITDSYFHDANVGHEIKSRAEDTVITDSRIFDNLSTASYSIDLPNGGNATITNNVIEQGPNTQNPNIIAYGEEGNLHVGTSVLIADNTIVNDDASNSARMALNRSPTTLLFQNNQISGLTAAQLSTGPLGESGTTFLTTKPPLNTASTWDSGALCFLKGTRIATPTSEVRVENLTVGDMVRTIDSEILNARPVKWLGRRRIDLTRHPRPETVAPIRIERAAFADNVPNRDLLVSPDHAIFVDGKLICARQLVNGTTIRRETGWSSVDYFHVELDAHAILLAEGLPAESYLDTGNRWFFAGAGAPLVLPPDVTDETGHPSREAGSCAPFVSDDANVRPVWQGLADRAAAIGRAPPVRVTTMDAGAHLQCPDGQTIAPIHRDNVRIIFALSGAASEVRLVCRAQSPIEARPWLSDPRRLGVRVKRIVLRDADQTCEVAMDHPDFARGWWAIEHDGPIMSRWTDGEAMLPLPPMRGPAMLEICLAGAMIYVEDAVPEDVSRHRAA